MSPGELLASLDRGEIIRGDKGFETVVAGSVTLQFNRATGELYFTENGVTTHALVTENGDVTGIQLTEDVTGAPYRDRELARVKQQFLESIATQLRA